ncbi:SigB/SigF/SigG family RNA polymerase sigma factor [Nocardia sp. NPDC003482]
MTSLLDSNTVSTTRARRGSDPYDGIEPWLEKMAALPEHDPERSRLRTDIVGRCLPLAEHIARRYTGRGETYEDLYQVASVGLLLAVDRFDAGKGCSFLAFAVPTIMGEVRRHFRDRTWAVRVPRPTKELQSALGPVIERLSQRLHRMPTASELAAELDVDLLEITQALLAANAYNTDTIDGPSDDADREPGTSRVLEELGGVDGGYELTENALAVAPLLAALPERERHVLQWRFFENLTQTQIAQRLSISQMQVSRIITKTLATLREDVLRD